MEKVLNPTLYYRLKRLFGRVKIADEGEAMIHRAVRGLEDELRVVFEHDGEYYRVCCPFCNDTRYRLYVNHMWGRRDDHGRRMLFLMVCFNEHCTNKHENKEKFIESIDDPVLAECMIKKGVVVPLEARRALPPGPTTPVDRLRPNHPARDYLRNVRGFDEAELAKTYGVGYCTESVYSLAERRIIIPVYEGDTLKGWQARHVGELDWKGPEKSTLPPKYFSCPGSKFRSQCIYNIDRMKKWHTGIVVEGPMDVWRFGAMSGCIFGNTMTEAQKAKLLAHFRHRTVVLLLDPEEFESRTTRNLVSYMETRMPGRVCAVKLPDGTDPGSLDREFLRAYVKEQAAAQGVQVKYRLVTSKFRN